MTTYYTIHHATHFAYERPVSFARCNLRLKPVDWPGQRLLSHEISVTPAGRLTPALRGPGLRGSMFFNPSDIDALRRSA